MVLVEASRGGVLRRPRAGWCHLLAGVEGTTRDDIAVAADVTFDCFVHLSFRLRFVRQGSRPATAGRGLFRQVGKAPGDSANAHLS